MQDWLSDNLWAIWLGVALVLGVVEAATADFVFLMLAGGALVGSAGAWFGLGPVGQVLLAVVTSIALLGVVRPLAKRRLMAGADEGAMGVDRYVGERVVVTEVVSEQAGYAVLHGDTWSARVPDGEPDIPSGAEALVAEVRGAALVLHPVAPLRDVIPREDRP
ncbi:NfeD family protein [Agilicoccus flavus]|uniref:NfeD family protein n=1 Tax=Agilicoccus flavus TaxID=2775968 RepID=UPI001CF6B9AF|nr:NfeD family protein [Agilicoccus flavus]